MDIPAIQQANIILASQSPRRQQLLKELGINYTIRTKEVEETYPEQLIEEHIPMYLSKLKAQAFVNELTENDILITADTIVWVDNKVLGKPVDYEDAFRMLRILSGNKHTVYTGVCLTSLSKQEVFFAKTDVYFRNLETEEIEFYLNHFKPFDKAGAYGIQEWIGYVSIERIEGSYFNVMGLPIQKLYDKLKRF